MALSRMEENGSVYAVTSLPALDVYQKYLNHVLPTQQGATSAYVATVIGSHEKFSLATAFANPWPPELDSIWNFIQDETLAAFVLAYIVMEQLMAAPNKWMCTKTNIQDRDFATNFYWKV